MIRVLHYGMSPNLGGIETYLLNLARTVDASRFMFDFVYSDYGQLPVFAPDLATSRFFGVTPRRVSPRRNRRDLDELFANEQFDILHFHANTASYVAPVKAALRHGVRVVYHSHNAGASRSQLTVALHWCNRRTLPWGEINKVAVSSEAGRWMFGSQPFQVIHNGIDVDAFAFDPQARAAVRAELGIGEDAFVVGSVAAFVPAKNHTFLLRVFAELARRHEYAYLLLVGTGPSEADVRRQSSELGLEPRVRFLGRRPDVPNLLSAMDSLVLPSLHEGFPMVIVEAQASGIPCFLSDAVTSEVLASQSSARLALAAEPTVWADALLRATPAERTLGTNAVEAAGFTTARNTSEVEAVYQRSSGS